MIFFWLLSRALYPFTRVGNWAERRFDAALLRTQRESLESAIAKAGWDPTVDAELY